MLAGTVDVVVRKGLHPVVVYTLLEAMADAHRGATFISNAGAYPTISGAELPIQELAQEYYRSGMPWVYRNLPAWPASFVDRYLLVALSIFVLCEIYRIATYFGEISLFLLLLRSGRTHRERGEPVRNRKFWEMRS
jgi:hypothetical protein